MSFTGLLLILRVS